MSSTTTAQPDQGRKIVVAVLGFGLLILFIGSFIYRLQNPSLTIQAKQSESCPAMDNIAELMARLDSQPDHLPTLMALGDQFMRVESWGRAEIFWKLALAVDPLQDRALNGLGVTYYNQDQFAESAEQFQQIVAMQPDNHRAHFNLGTLYKHYLDDAGKARLHFERVLELNPADAELIARIQGELSDSTPSSGQ